VRKRENEILSTEEELKIIRDHYDGSSFRLSKIIRLIGRGKYPRWYIGRIAREMGLTHVKESHWTAAEESYVDEHYPKMGLKALRRGLINNGMFPRSTTAIKLKIRRLGLLSSDDDGFTMRGLQNFLWGGQEQHHIITRWIENGWLKGMRRGTLRKASRQGGDTWYFDPEWVRAFIIAHPEEIDLRMVDPVAFIRLVAGDNLTLPAACQCPGCGAEFEKRLFNPGLQVLRIYCHDCKTTHDEDGEEYRIATLRQCAL